MRRAIKGAFMIEFFVFITTPIWLPILLIVIMKINHYL